MASQKASYYNEISLMMFGFGDSHKPNPDTVRHVENITRSQLHIMIQEVLKGGEKNEIKGESLIFLLRRNKWKMRRFVKYLINKNSPLGSQLAFADICEFEPKRMHPLLKFIEYIDETGELTDLSEFDEVVYERRVRADRISRLLGIEKYMEFNKARSITFSSKKISNYLNCKRLKQWLDLDDQYIFNDTAFEVLSYYAYQTVAEITDCALIVRMDSKRTHDPFNHLNGVYHNADMFKGDRFSGANPDYSSVYQSGQEAITVQEIDEVIRRFNTPKAGVLDFGGKLPNTRYLFAL